MIDTEKIKQIHQKLGRVQAIKFLIRTGKSVRESKKIIDNLSLTNDGIEAIKNMTQLNRKIRKLGKILNDL